MENLLKQILYSIFNLFVTAVVLWWNVIMVIDTVNFQKYPWNAVTTSLVVSAGILLVVWFIPFIKFLRNLAIFILVIALGIWFAFINIYPQFTNNMNLFIKQHQKDGEKIKIESQKVFKDKKQIFNFKKHTYSLKNKYVLKVKLKKV